MSIVHVPFYPSDWLAGTRGFSAVESGVYITLICRMYEEAGPVERDDSRLARTCGCSVQTFRKTLDFLMAEGKVTEDENGLFNDKVADTLENISQKSEKARTSAKRRWARKSNKNKGGSDADAMRTHKKGICESHANHKPLTIDADDARARAREGPTFREQLLTAIGADPESGILGPNGKMIGTRAHMAEAEKWLDDLGLSESECVCVIGEVVARMREPAATFKYFTPAMRDLAAAKARPKLDKDKPNGQATTTDDICRAADAIAERLRRGSDD